VITCACFNSQAPRGVHAAATTQFTGKVQPIATSRRHRQRTSAPSMTISREDAVREALAAEDAVTEPARPRAVMANIKDVGRPFPMSLIIGNDNIKTALLLAAVNPAMGGVVVSGRRGTAKSVLARALHRIMPPIERVKDSQYNLDPEDPTKVDSFTQAMLDKEGKTLGELEREIIETPFVQVPLNVMEDRLLGSVDVEESVRVGKTVFMPGLLAKAHRGGHCTVVYKVVLV
jgi:magnesium chelatase subunit D